MQWLWNSQKNCLPDMEQTYLKVEFLTQEQKVKKHSTRQILQKKFAQDEDSIIPYEQNLPCSFRCVLNLKHLLPPAKRTNSPQVSLKQVLDHIIVAVDPKLKEFYERNVEKIDIVLMRDKPLSHSDFITLYDQATVSSYEPDQVLEVIYCQLSFWQRLKNKAKTTIKSIPQIIMNFFKKLLQYILMLMGLDGSLSSLIWRAIPSKMILQGLSLVITMFFPILGPFLGLGKMIL